MQKVLQNPPPEPQKGSAEFRGGGCGSPIPSLEDWLLMIPFIGVFLPPTFWAKYSGPFFVNVFRICPPHCGKISQFSPDNFSLSGQAIRTPMFRRFARIDSRESIRRKIPIFEALSQIRSNRVFSRIRIEIRVIRVQSSLLSHYLKGRFAKRRFFRSENRFARIGPLSFV